MAKNDDNIEVPARGYDTQDVKAQQAAERGKRKRRWGLKAFLYLILLPIAVIAAWTWAAMSFSYSRGQRVGYVQKLSEKGWLCRTWEGELAMSNVPGSMPEKFYFSVRDDEVAKQIQAKEGSRVAVTYEQHRGVPTSCFGESQYWATGVTDAK